MPYIAARLTLKKRITSVPNSLPFALLPHFCPGFRVYLHNEWFINVRYRLRANVLDSSLPIAAQLVEPKAVLFFVNQLDQSVAEFDPLVRGHDALENRVLDALTVV